MLSVRFGTVERSSALTAWLPPGSICSMAGRREAFVAWQGAFRPFRNGRKKLCLDSLASPIGSFAFQKDEPGFPKAAGSICSMAGRREAFVAWHGAFRPFRNGRKKFCLDSLASLIGSFAVFSVRFGTVEKSSALTEKHEPGFPKRRGHL